MRPRFRQSPQFLSMLLLSLLMFGPGSVTANEDPKEQLVLWKRNYDSPAIRSLLEIVLDKTTRYGTAELVASAPMSQGRALKHLEEGNHDSLRIANVASSPERNRKLQPIRIPVDQGLLGVRVCLIREGNQPRFDGIHSADDFQERDLLIGQGSHWPDTRILRDSGFEVITTPDYSNLFPMLRHGRFDCFLRGIGEVLIDLEQARKNDIVIEDTLVFTYEMPSYFFVGPGEDRLAERIRTGLARAMRDGAYDEWFRTYFRRPMEQLDLMQRTFIPLPNPLLEDGGSPAKLPVLPINPERYLPVPVEDR